MNKPVQRLIIVSGLVAMMVGMGAWYVADRQRHKHWPQTQMQRCTALARLLCQYEQKNGSYPASLRDLVDHGLISPTEYQKLMFQAGPRAGSIEWQYHRPSSPTSFALLSSQPIHPWQGSSGVYIIGRPDGSCQSFSDAKLAWYKQMIQAEQGATQPPH